MKQTNYILSLVSILFLFILSACGSGSDSSADDDNPAFQVYNVSVNSQPVHLIVDQDDNDDFSKREHTAVSYPLASQRYEFPQDSYDIELAWKDDNNELQQVYASQVNIQNNNVNFIVFAEDIQNPRVEIYEIPTRNDDEKSDDRDNEVFNLRLLNLHSEQYELDLYLSESDETFNEAQLIGEGISYTELTDNQKIALETYNFYITEAGNSEVLYQSNDVNFSFTSEYILAVRENKGPDASPFTIDIISPSSITEYAPASSQAAFRIYNGIKTHDMIPEYQNTLDLYINGAVQENVTDISYGELSEKTTSNFGDYSVSLLTPDSQYPVVDSHLLTLSENSDKTLFFYLLEEDVDRDNDGNVDENGDGIVDEIKVTTNSLSVTNSISESIFSHEIKVINFIDDAENDEEFSVINVYFVKSDETIETTNNNIIANFASVSEVNLLNNTYSVFVIGRLNSSEIILDMQTLVLNEESKDQFLVIEESTEQNTAYKMTFIEQ